MDVYAKKIRELRQNLASGRQDVNGRLPESRDYPLHLAARANDQQLCADLLDMGADINPTNNFGNTPLGIAVIERKAGMVDFLLQQGADPNYLDPNRTLQTPLHNAVVNNELGIAQQLMLHGANPNTPDKNGRTAYDEASPGLRAHMNEWARQSTPNPSAIEWQPATVEPSPVQDVNARDANGDTQLHACLSRGVALPDWEGAKTLIAAGADINAKNNRGATPLMVALEARRDESLIADLIDRGADVNATDRTGQSALMWATAENTPDQVQLLIERGAHIDHRDHDGMTALNHCVESAQTDMAGLLLQHGADPNLGNQQGRTPLHTLAQHNIIHAVHNRRGTYSTETQQKMATALLDAGANPIKRDIEGDTPLAVAAANRHAGLATTLIEAGADPRLTNHQGKSALDLAKDQPTHDAIAPRATQLTLEAALAMEQSQSRERNGRRM